jgi:hypothetical protein
MTLQGEIATELANNLIDKGLLIEAGFIVFCVMMYGSGFTAMPPDQVRQLRHAYLAGAQNLWGSVMNMLDPGMEPSERDLRRMDLINEEIRKFHDELAAQMMKTKGSA